MGQVTWLTGNSGSWKTTTAKAMVQRGDILLDGDEMRKCWEDLDMSEKDRWEQNIRVARIAKVLSDQGFNVIVAVICPYRDLRRRVKTITNCKFIYLEGGRDGDKYPYEHPVLY